MRAHAFADGKCVHCGAREFNGRDKSCIWRADAPEGPRPRPPSFDAEIGSIGDRMREIRAEEDRALASAVENDPDIDMSGWDGAPKHMAVARWPNAR